MVSEAAHRLRQLEREIKELLKAHERQGEPSP